jgi:hypothetical protein
MTMEQQPTAATISDRPRKISTLSALAILLIVIAGQTGICYLSLTAARVGYDNSISQLEAADVQTALDQLDQALDLSLYELDVISPPAITVRYYNRSAESVGRNAKVAEEVYYQDHDSYTNQLTQLIRVDRNLADDPEVTFTFFGANIEGYTYKTSHYRGDKSFYWRD